MEIQYKSKWEESYNRRENYIFFPKEEIVKFINRYVRKKIGPVEFKNILDVNETITALDFGCGIGRQTILLEEFGIQAQGLDLSSSAIIKAQELAVQMNFPGLVNNFLVYDGGGLPFKDSRFNISIAESVLDSMPYADAKEIIKELARITKNYIYISLISGTSQHKPREYDGEEVVLTTHESGTIQSFYNFSKITSLISDIPFTLDYCNLVTEESIKSDFLNSRYYLVLKRTY
jgi:ubiquinone/menaquinone biosynthesis C-methylase UbiE